MLGTSASSSISLLTAIRNNGSFCIGDAVAPTTAVLRVTTPAAGAFKIIELRAAAGTSCCPSPVCRANLTRVWPDVTRSPSPTSTSVTLRPGASRFTVASSRATRKPVTRMVAEKHALVARTTLTWTAGGEVVSAAKSVVDELARRTIPPTRVALAAAMKACAVRFMLDTRMCGPCLSLDCITATRERPESRSQNIVHRNRTGSGMSNADISRHCRTRRHARPEAGTVP